jgi:hypothetical protein
MSRYIMSETDISSRRKYLYLAKTLNHCILTKPNVQVFFILKIYTLIEHNIPRPMIFKQNRKYHCRNGNRSRRPAALDIGTMAVGIVYAEGCSRRSPSAKMPCLAVSFALDIALGVGYANGFALGIAPSA